MKPEDEAGMNRVLDTLQIPRGLAKRRDSVASSGNNAQLQPVTQSPAHTPSPLPSLSRQPGGTEDVPKVSSPSHSVIPNQGLIPPVEKSQVSMNPLAMNPGLSANHPSTHWGFTLPTAESLDALYANIDGASNRSNENSTSPDSLQFTPDITQQPGVLLSQAWDRDNESDSGEEDEAEKDVIEQISHRIGTLKIAGDGHLRFYGATSNLNLVDVSATQQRQRPDARTVRHDGQDILNHLRVGQPVDQALEDHLVELYFTWQNPSTYVVDKDMYMDARMKWRNDLIDTPFYSEVLTNAM